MQSTERPTHIELAEASKVLNMYVSLYQKLQYTALTGTFPIRPEGKNARLQRYQRKFAEKAGEIAESLVGCMYDETLDKGDIEANAERLSKRLKAYFPDQKTRQKRAIIDHTDMGHQDTPGEFDIEQSYIDRVVWDILSGQSLEISTHDPTYQLVFAVALRESIPEEHRKDAPLKIFTRSGKWI